MIVKNLKQMREKSNISLYELSKMSGVAYSMLYYAENDNSDIRVSTLLKIAKALGVTANDLLY